MAYLLGMLTAYLMARRFAIQASGRAVVSELKRFTVVNVFSLVLVWSISIALARHLFPVIGFGRHTEDLAHFIGVAAPAVVSYFEHRAYTFASLQRDSTVRATAGPDWTMRGRVTVSSGTTRGVLNSRSGALTLTAIVLAHSG